MLVSDTETCPECSGRIIDAGDELVCDSCGVVLEKLVLQEKKSKGTKAIDLIQNSLGGYLGPIEYGYEEIFSKGFSTFSSSFKYLKTISDFSGRESGSLYSCVKLIERVCEKLSLPKYVMTQAVFIAKRIMNSLIDASTGVVSAYSIIAACKIERITNIGLRDVIEVHKKLGKKVSVSSLIHLYLESPVKQEARNAFDYIARVINVISNDEKIKQKVPRYLINEYISELYHTAAELLKEVKESRLGGHNPCAVAATSVYAAEYLLSKKQKRKKIITQGTVAKAAKVAEYTVREQFGKLFKEIIKLRVKD